MVSGSEGFYCTCFEFYLFVVHVIKISRYTFSLRYKNKTSFAVHYVKNGPKVDSTIEPQYETCAEVKITESDYAAYNVTGEQIT